MPSNNENQSIMQHLVRGSRDFALVDSEFILKINPKVSVSAFVSKVEELIVEGQTEDALNLLKVLNNPDAFVMRGCISQVGGITSTQRVEQFMRSDLEKQLKESGSQGTIQNALDTMTAIMSDLTWKEKLELMVQRTSIWIVDLKDIRSNINQSTYRVMVSRYIPSFVMQCIDDERNKEGQWKFPKCHIGIDISIAGSGLSINPKVFVVHPRKYTHPFVFSGQQNMCLGAGGRKAIKDKMSRTSSTYRIIKALLDKGEQILRSGYNKPKSRISPANGHIWDPKYKSLKISDTVTDDYREMIKGYQKVQRKVKRRR